MGDTECLHLSGVVRQGEAECMRSAVVVDIAEQEALHCRYYAVEEEEIAFVVEAGAGEGRWLSYELYLCLQVEKEPGHHV